MFFHFFQCFSASAQFARPSTRLELQKENWSIEFRTSRTWFSPGGGADVFSCGPNLDKRKQLYSRKSIFSVQTIKDAAHKSNTMSVWLLVIPFPHHGASGAATPYSSFFKWLVPKPFSGNTNPRNSLDSNAFSRVESKQLREGKSQYTIYKCS